MSVVEDVTIGKLHAETKVATFAVLPKEKK